MGQVRDTSGNLIEDTEGLAYIPAGPNKGIYGAANFRGDQPTQLAKISAANARATVHATGLTYVEGMIAVPGPDADPVNDFSIVAKKLRPNEDFALELTVLGTALQDWQPMAPGFYNLGITLQVQLGTTTDPFGSWDLPVSSTLNDDNNPRKWVAPGTFPANTQLTIVARGWTKMDVWDPNPPDSDWWIDLEVDTQTNSPNILVLRDGDQVPDIPGFQDQPSIEDFVEPYLDMSTDPPTLDLGPHQAIYLFEVGTEDLSKPYADFQDLVVLASFADDPDFFTSPGGWTLFAVHRGGAPWGGDMDTPELIRIDPQTGIPTLIMNLDNMYGGLTLGPDGTLYGVKKNNGLYIIVPDPNDVDGGTETLLGGAGFDKVEALEFAFGDNAPQIDATPYVPSSWTQNGILFAFDDDADAFMIMDPLTGNSAEYTCAFEAQDCEGLVFVTTKYDPLHDLLKPYD